MFETRTEIRRAARERYIAKAVEKAERRGAEQGERRGEERGERRGQRRTEERIKSILDKRGIEIPPDVEQELFENGNGRKG